MTETAQFKVFCLECYKSAHKMKGRDAFNLFKQYGVLEYIGSFYDVLHSFGHKYIVQDIDEFIDTRRK